jgi:hypothetical protein
MRRLARVPALLLATVALGACGTEAEEAAAPSPSDATRLTVEVTRVNPEPIFMTLRCGDAEPCDPEQIQTLDRALHDTEDPAQACTLQYGGPERAHVTGTLEGRAVDVTLTRANGCEIAGYDALFTAFGRRPPLAG